MSETDTSEPNRRDFLGAIGLVLATGNLTSLSAATTITSDRQVIFDGSLRELATGMQLDPGWNWEFDSLIEAVDQPRSAWIVGPYSRLELAMDWCCLSPEQMTSLLRSSGVRTQGEIDFSYRDEDGNNDKEYFVEIIVCELPSQTRQLWKQVEACRAEWELVPSKLAGETMFISNGGHAIPGKTWFVRANVLVSVTAFFMEQEGAARFAAKLDEHICSCLRNS